MLYLTAVAPPRARHMPTVSIASGEGVEKYRFRRRWWALYPGAYVALNLGLPNWQYESGETGWEDARICEKCYGDGAVLVCYGVAKLVLWMIVSNECANGGGLRIS
jgi:hypothetical protein